MLAAAELEAAWAERVRSRPHDAYVVTIGGSWTVGAHEDRVLSTMSSLRALGMAAHDRVLVQVGNSASALQLHHALRRMGVVIVPIHPELNNRERDVIVHHCEPDWVVLPRNQPAWTEFEDGTVLELDDPQLVVRRRCTSWPSARHQSWLTDVDGGWIVYTSGSSGRPKGVVLPRVSFDLCGQGFAGLFGLTSSDRFLLCFPMSHTVGTHAVPASSIACAGSVAVMPGFSVSRFWEWVDALCPTAAILFPSQLTLLTGARGSARSAGSMRMVITHSHHSEFARCYPDVKQATVWGMTETGGVCVGELSDRVAHQPRLLGRPMVDGQMRIRDRDGDLAAEGSVGEIEFRSQAQMLGYHRDPELSEEAIRGGWIASGDLGFIASGDLHYVGRLKNVIKRSGETILGEDVEEALVQHPDIVECIVAAVPDPIRTEEVAAMVTVTNESLRPELVAEWCRTRIAAWKVPRFWVIRDEPLPRLLNGKLARAEVAEILARPEQRVDLEVSSTPTP